MDVQITNTVPHNWEDPIFTASQAENLLRQPYHQLFVIPGGGHLLALLTPSMPADILTLYVPPVARRCGHAKALVEAVISQAKASGCTGLTLEVSAENAAAVALYTVCGLQQVARRANYYPNPVSKLKADALVLAVSFA